MKNENANENYTNEKIKNLEKQLAELKSGADSSPETKKQYQ